MSQEAAAKFRDLIGQDRVLQQKIAGLMQGQTDIDGLVALGAEKGCEFTADEANALIEATFGDNAEGELSDFELELVAGGASKYNPAPVKVKAPPKKSPVVVSNNCGMGVIKAGQVAISTSSTC